LTAFFVPRDALAPSPLASLRQFESSGGRYAMLVVLKNWRLQCYSLHLE